MSRSALSGCTHRIQIIMPHTAQSLSALSIDSVSGEALNFKYFWQVVGVFIAHNAIK
jgi:hypothetical protein